MARRNTCANAQIRRGAACKGRPDRRGRTAITISIDSGAVDETPEPFVFLSEDEFNKLSGQEKRAYLRRAVEAVLFPPQDTSDTSTSDETSHH